MNCEVCLRPCTPYDIFRVACTNGHIWTLPQFEGMPLPPVDAEPSRKPAPSWLPGAALGGLALLVSLLEVVL